jgi:hypothetical protein
MQVTPALSGLVRQIQRLDYGACPTRDELSHRFKREGIPRYPKV